MGHHLRIQNNKSLVSHEVRGLMKGYDEARILKILLY